MEILLTPPLAFLVYLGVSLGILGLGRVLAPPERPSPLKESPYASGEEAETTFAAPGYAPFFLIAFFFAVVHLGVLILGTGALSPRILPYLLGLLLTLIAVILG
ncbi:hypothetical protein [uncultured Thermanaerothrix sp.]|uniref:hypothetical protein n=1 Tax=uncultured Thermanaerothrix sp. TaxID=1195149 RepID=UPI002611DD73|nr:hypothetical protein [uncultured Thermanaerothrix sp.]